MGEEARGCQDCEIVFETPGDADRFGYCVDEESCAWRCTYNQGSRETIARVVAWLRRENMASCTGRVLADALERGDWKGGEDG